MRFLILVLALVGCDHSDRAETKREPESARRVIEPPTGRVRPLPPHAIRADGVGPYRLGEPLAELSAELPSGPRIATIDLPGVVHRSILRAEDDAIVIGGEPLGKASFVAVVGGEVARTESGIHVGSTRDEVVRALGVPLEDPERARDPRLLVPTGMRNARIVMDDDHVAAIAITNETLPPPGEPIERDTPDPEKIGARVPGLVFAAPLRDPADGKDELVAITRAEDGSTRTWSLQAFRLEGTRWQRTIDPSPVYSVSAPSARWIGAELGNLDLYIELHARPDAIDVGGILTTRIGGKLRDVVVISPQVVARRRAKSAPPEASDAGISEGSEHH